MYISFIRREHLECFRGLVRCSLADSAKLEQVQFTDARTVTCLPLITSKDSPHFQTDWSTQSSRRIISRLKAIHNIDENITYAQNLFPDKHCTTSNNTLRNFQDYYLSKCRLQIYTSSLVPAVIREWNSLPLNIRDLDSPKTFTIAITCYDILNAKKLPPPYFFFWRQIQNIINIKTMP